MSIYRTWSSGLSGIQTLLNYKITILENGTKELKEKVTL